MPPRTTPRPRARRLAVAVLAGTGLVPLAGCTAFSGGYVAPVVVTVTPTVTVTAAAPSSAAAPTPSPSTSTALPDIRSDDAGNKHDLGKIASVEDQQGVKVVTFDRYRKTGVRSATILADGVTLEPHRRDYFVNTSSQEYRIPVAPTATFVKQTCVTSSDPAQTTPSTLDELAGLQDREAIVLLDLDDKVWITHIASDPVCL